MTPLFWIHLLACTFMAGLIWVIQQVHYPMFMALRELPKRDFQAWMQFHTSHITPIVGPIMMIEAASAMWLVISPPKEFPSWLGFLNLVLVGVIFIATLFWSIPNHHALREDCFQQEAITQLVNGNWVRTIAWSLRLLLLGGWYLWQFQLSS